MKISDNTLESGHESWHLMDIGMIKEVAYMECHQVGRSSTQTAMSACPTMWIDVPRSNIVVHYMITGHWCILLTDVRSPTNNENGNQGTECNLTSVNRCVEVEHLEESIPKLSMAREPTTNDWKSQGTQMTLDTYSRTNDLKSMEWNPLEGGN